MEQYKRRAMAAHDIVDAQPATHDSNLVAKRVTESLGIPGRSTRGSILFVEDGIASTRSARMR